MTVQTLDLSHFLSGTAEQRQQFVHGLLTSFDQTGFVKLVNHGFSAEELAELFNWSTKFFDQSVEEKNEIPNETGPRPMRGYTGYRVEYTSKLHHDEKIRVMTDSKEHFDQGPEEDTEFPNKWPRHQQFTGFRPFMQAFYRQCDEVCLALVRALEVGFGVDEGELVKRCIPSATDLRLTNYPPIQAEEMRSGQTSRISPHTDFGIVTLLFQDTTGGLEIEDRTSPGEFLPVPPTDTTEMIVNVGDTLQRWTNDKLTGGIHRVTTPAALKNGNGDGIIIPGRQSMAYLFKAERNVSVAPLPGFCSAEVPARYPDMTALEFQRWRNNILYT